LIEGSVARDPYPDSDARGSDLEHIGEISVRAVLPTTKLRSCAGCSGRFVGRDLYEVMDWHESLMFFEGDRICEQCARNHGVL
jgi:hypothetical protein